MAAQREVKVIINGEEFVSQAAKKAEDGVDGFTGKMKGWFKSFVDFKAAWDLIYQGARRVTEVVTNSFAAYDELVNSQRKLQGTSKITGISLDELAATAMKGRDAFGLSRTTANDFATEVAKLEKASGGAASATDLLTSFLDIGAARGLTAAQTMQAVSQSLLGIDEGTDRIFGKNPSGLWADYALVIGKSAGKFTDMEKQAALAYAALDAGNKTVGSYAEFTKGATGQQEQFNNRINDARIAFAEAAQPLRLFILQFGTQFMPVIIEFSTVTAGALILAVTTIGQAFNGARSIIAFTAAALGMLTGDLGLKAWAAGQIAAANEFGKEMIGLRNKYGELRKAQDETKQSVREGTGALEDAIPAARGARTAFEGIASPLDRATDLFKQAEVAAASIGPTLDNASKKAKDHGTAHVDAAVKVESSNKKNAETTEQSVERMNKAIDAKLGKPLALVVELTEGAIHSLADAANAQLPPHGAEQFAAHMQSLADRAKEVGERITAVPPALEKGKQSGKALADEIGTVARGAIDAAQAFGVMDAQAASVLNSAINIASSIGQLASGNVFAGVGGILGGVANIVSTMMNGDADRKALLRSNNDQLRKLRTDGIPLTTKASGETIAKAKSALGGSLFSRVGNIGATMQGGGMSGLIELLSKNGLGLSDLDKIASDLGMNIRDKNGGVNFDALKQMIEGMNTTGFGGRVDQSFGSQLEFFKESQRLGGATGAGKIGGLLDFLRNVGGAGAFGGLDASDPAALRTALFNMFTQMNNGTGVDPALLGNLTGEQFQSLLIELIDLIDGMGSGGGSGGSGGGGGGDGGVVNIPGVGPVPSAAANALVDALAAQTVALGAYHTDSLGYQERTASATERTADGVWTIVERLAVFDPTAALDASLEAKRNALATQQGLGLVV